MSSRNPPKGTGRKKTAVPKEPKNPLMKDDREWDREKVLDVVCDRIACSNKGIASILAEPHLGFPLPTYSTFMKWLSEDSSLSDRYAHAKDDQLEFLEQEMRELHNKAWVPVVDREGNVVRDADGQIVMTVNKASAAIVRIEAENKKWLMGKLKPKKYGDKLQVGGAEDLPPMQTKTTMTPDEAYLALLNKQ